MKTMSSIIVGMFVLVNVLGQNPPKTGDPYVPRGKPSSPNGEYMIAVKTSPKIGYDLIEKTTSRAVASVEAYYPEANEFNEKYAKAIGVFWNANGNVVALDELNRRAAGYLYFLVLHNGTVAEIKADSLIPIPRSAELGRTVVDKGWISPTKVTLRLSLTEGGEHTDTFYIVDFSDPRHPKAQKIARNEK
jgi:hypothetical protein